MKEALERLVIRSHLVTASPRRRVHRYDAHLSGVAH